MFTQLSLLKSYRNTLVSIILIVNVFVWYSYATAILIYDLDKAAFAFNEKLIIYGLGITGAVLSILVGACISDRFNSRKHFLFIWIMMGALSSILFIFSEAPTMIGMSILFFAVNFSFGFGLPVSLACFAESTLEGNRGRFATITLLIMFFTSYALNSLISEHAAINSLILTFLRILGFVMVFINRNSVGQSEGHASSSLTSILKERSFILYAIPWTLFSIVNYLGWPIGVRFHGEEFTYFCASVETIVAALFSVIAGFGADIIGRKRTLMVGFIIFGLGYGILGIYPYNVLAWYLYTIADGIAWGIIFVIFWFTIWGDLAQGKRSEKYYALGLLPYSFSGFLRVTAGPLIADIVSEYAIFSFAALFLFLAVIPLMYAPETLPEKVVRERELRGYVERAKRLREKFT